MPAPEGAQLSPDGLYWWDDHSQNWQLVDSDGQAADGGQGGQSGQGGQGGGHDAGTALIVFADMQMLTENAGAAPMLWIDSDDNPNNNDVPRADNGIQGSWADFNRGTADAQGYSDTCTLSPAGNTQGSGSLDNLNLAMGHGEMRNVKLGRLPAGHYDFTVTLNGGVSLQHLNFEVQDAPNP